MFRGREGNVREKSKHYCSQNQNPEIKSHKSPVCIKVYSWHLRIAQPILPTLSGFR